MHGREIFFVVLWESLITINDAQPRQHAKKREDTSQKKSDNQEAYTDGIHSSAGKKTFHSARTGDPLI
jgi:hypothetical protein